MLFKKTTKSVKAFQNCHSFASTLSGLTANHSWVSKSKKVYKHNCWSSNRKAFVHDWMFYLPIRISSIELADCVSCFLDVTDNLQTVRTRLKDFQTNLALCGLQSLAKFSCDDDDFKVAFKCTLFDTECVLVEFNDIACPAENPSIQHVKCNRDQSSKVFFYASTSGSCGDSKIIGVTYKCFMPNIASLG